MPAWTTRVRYTVSFAALRGEGTATYAENALSTNQLNQLVLHGAVGVALSIGLEVAQVTDVALGVNGGAVGLAEGVDLRHISCDAIE